VERSSRFDGGCGRQRGSILLGPEGTTVRVFGSVVVFLVQALVWSTSTMVGPSWGWCWGVVFRGGGGFCLLFENCTVDASIFVVKFIRANGGCLGTRSR
jgi:hypothetical protein